MSDDDPIPRIDLSDRYQKVINIQTKSIENFDDKTWRTMRLTGIILGIGIGAVSYFSNSGGLPDGIPFQIVLSISVLSFISSFGLGIRSYQSTAFATGPNEEIGRKIKDKPPDVDEYRCTVVDNYTNAIGHNKGTLKEKKRKFRSALATLFFGVWSLALAFLLVVWDLNPHPSYILIAGSLILGGAVTIATMTDEDGDSEEDDGEDGTDDGQDQ